MNWILGAPLLLCFAVAADNVGETVKWENTCPISCTCLMTELRDLPMYVWYLEATTNDTKAIPNYVHSNEALNHDFPTPPEYQHLSLMRSAICIFQESSDSATWLNDLPSDVQMLTLLKSPGSGKLTLEGEHFSMFSSLEALEIKGSQSEEEAKRGDVIIMSDTLRTLSVLKFLNLENVHLLGQPDIAPKPLRNVNYNEYLPEKEREKDWKQSALSHELIFLAPSDPLPYNEYKTAQEREGLSAFAGLSSLLFLRVFNCGVKEVRWEMFEGLIKLQYLSLENNELHFIPDFAFYGAMNLKYLSISKNKILNLQFTSLAGLLDLEKLDISYNNISHLTELSLPPFPKLLLADFRYNPIERVFPATFEIMNKTETLFLGNNDKSLELKHNSWQGLHNLRHLTIFNAVAKTLEQDMLKGTPRLRALQLQGNITELAYDAFLSVPKLEVLILNHCNIKQVSMDSFYGLHALMILDLSFNSLDSLPPDVFNQLHSLRELQLQNNQFTELPFDIFSELPSKLIRLDENPWHCSCAMKDWRPMAINKIKVKGKEIKSVGKYSIDASIQVRQTQYMFEKRVAPKCKTPIKYLNWNVFHVLRKELRCDKIKFKRPWKLQKELRKNITEAKLKNEEKKLAKSEVLKIDEVKDQTEVTIVNEISSTISSTENAATTKPPQILSNNFDADTKTMPKQEQTEEKGNDLGALPVETKILNLKSNLRFKDQAVPVPKEPHVSNGDFFIQHEGKPVKVSKKAYKLELEKIRSEKLKLLKQG